MAAMCAFWSKYAFYSGVAIRFIYARITRGEMSQAWEYFSRAFDVYAFMGKKAQTSRCLARLQEVNSQGGLGHSLERFQKQAQVRPAGN